MPIPSGVDQKKSKVYVQKTGGEYIQILPESFCESEILEGSMWPVSSHALKQYSNSIEERIAPFAGATANRVGKIGTVPEAKSSERTYFLRGDGKWVQIVITDERVKAIKDATKKFYLTGTDINDNNVSVSYFDSGVYVSANAGELCATKFKGNLEGNVKGNLEGTASKATADANGNNIANTYATKTALQSGYAPLDHKHNSSEINALNGYSKGSSTAAISAADTLNQALGKLEKKLDGMATLNSPSFTGTPTTPNIGSNSGDGQVANKKYVDDRISGLVNGAGTALDTLKELANALGNDANFASTMTTKLGTKLDKASANYVKSLSISDNTAGSGQLLKVQRGDDTTYNLTIKDTLYTPASANPKASGTASPGTSVKYAREDHVHPLQTTVSGKASTAGTADQAGKLTTPRKLRTNLASTAEATFDGSVDQLNIPVTGILPVANGGTGAGNLNGLVQTGNVNQTIGGTKTFSNKITGSISNADVSAKTTGTPAGTTWVAGATSGKALVNATTTGYGAILNASTKNNKIALSTYPSNTDLVYLYSVTNANVSSETNTINKALTWNAATGELIVDSIKSNSGTISGKATSAGTADTATSATKDGNGNVITSTYLPLAGGTVTGTLNLTRTTDAQGTGSNAPALRIGALTGAHLELDGDELMAKASGNTVGTLYLNRDGGLVSIGSGGLTVAGKITGNLKGDVEGTCTTAKSCSGNANTATSAGKLNPGKNINGTLFDGTGAITTALWGTARDVSISDASNANTGSAVSVNGSKNVTLKLPATIKANAPTQANSDSSDAIATTKFVKNQNYITSAIFNANKGLGIVSNKAEVKLKDGGGIKFDSSGNLYIDFSLDPNNSSSEQQAFAKKIKDDLLSTLGIQIPMTGNKTFYVDGSSTAATTTWRNSSGVVDQTVGTTSKPFKTVQSAINCATQGYAVGAYTITIRIKPGTYKENLSLPIYTRTTGGIQLIADNNANPPVIQNATACGEIMQVKGTGWTLQRLTLRGIRTDPGDGVWHFPSIIHAVDGASININAVSFEDSYSGSSPTDTGTHVALRTIEMSGSAVMNFNIMEGYATSMVVHKNNATSLEVFVLTTGSSVNVFGTNKSTTTYPVNFNVTGEFTTFVAGSMGATFRYVGGSTYTGRFVASGTVTGKQYKVSRCAGVSLTSRLSLPGTEEGTATASTYGWYTNS